MRSSREIYNEVGEDPTPLNTEALTLRFLGVQAIALVEISEKMDRLITVLDYIQEKIQHEDLNSRG